MFCMINMLVMAVLGAPCDAVVLTAICVALSLSVSINWRSFLTRNFHSKTEATVERFSLRFRLSSSGGLIKLKSWFTSLSLWSGKRHSEVQISKLLELFSAAPVPVYGFENWMIISFYTLTQKLPVCSRETGFSYVSGSLLLFLLQKVRRSGVGKLAAIGRT